MRLAGEVSLRASPVFVAVLAALHLAAFVLPWLSHLNLAAALATDACALASALLVMRQLRFQRAHALRLHDAGHVAIVDGEDVRAVVLGPQSSCFGGFLIALRWTELGVGRRGSACLLRFGMPEQDWRLLARWLRWRLLSPDRPSA